MKLVVFSLLAYNTTYENVTKITHFSQYFAHISSKNRTCKKIRSAIQRACRGLHIDTSYYFQGGRVGGIKIFVINNNANFGQADLYSTGESVFPIHISVCGMEVHDFAFWHIY